MGIRTREVLKYPGRKSPVIKIRSSRNLRNRQLNHEKGGFIKQVEVQVSMSNEHMLFVHSKILHVLNYSATAKDISF